MSSPRICMKFFGVIVFPNPRSRAYESPKSHYEPNSLLKGKIAWGKFQPIK
jgi:hypothetical protein